jgi:hypothetical protein
MEEQKKYVLNELVNISGRYDELLYEGEIRLSAKEQNMEVIISKPKTESCPQYLNVKVIKDKNEMDIDIKAEVVKDAYHRIVLMD